MKFFYPILLFRDRVSVRIRVRDRVRVEPLENEPLDYRTLRLATYSRLTKQQTSVMVSSPLAQ